VIGVIAGSVTARLRAGAAVQDRVRRRGVVGAARLLLARDNWKFGDERADGTADAASMVSSSGCCRR
jgi:hypothetical protein